ncbi:MAG: DNA polymerase III subunit [Oscillospiraceae bacterium]|nr:DNA polymerase III subunit [Oscillospiraceae bacterium]
MGFRRLLGNDQLKQNLTNALHSGHISHFYLISGPAGSGRHTLARLLAAAILCPGQQKPCMGCSTCRKVMADTHPDFITVNDPTHKTIPVDMLRDMREDLFIRPNEAAHKIYMIDQEMRTEGQNALLKVLEEPPKYGVFILITDNAESLLPTVRSRCTPLQLQPLPEKTLLQALQSEFPNATGDDLRAAAVRSCGFLGQAKKLLDGSVAVAPQTENFVKSFSQRDPLLLVQTLVPMEKWKRDQMIPTLQHWLELLEGALSCRAGMPGVDPLSRTLSANRSSQDLMQAISCLQKAIEYAQGNVSIAAVCGYLSWTLR